VKLINEGLWYKKDKIEIQYGKNPNDDSFLSPDNGLRQKSEQIDVNTIQHYVNHLDIEKIDFLKVEAEGAEPEIIKGLNQLRPRNIVVNAGEERDGRPTGREVMELLQDMGYNLVGVKRGRVLFFTLEKVGSNAFADFFTKSTLEDNK